MTYPNASILRSCRHLLHGSAVAALLSAALIAPQLAGCGSDGTFVNGEVCGNGRDDDGNGAADCDDSACKAEAACKENGSSGGSSGGSSKVPNFVPPLPSGPPRMQLVIDRVILPKTSANFAIDLDNDGTKDNKLGAIIGILQSVATGLDLQTQVDSVFKSGMLLLLAELYTKSLTTDPSGVLAVNLGRDTDNDASNNFTGQGKFRLHARTPKDLRLAVLLKNGRMDTKPGRLKVPLPLVPGQPAISLTLLRARIQGVVSAKGITQGILSGAIPREEVDNVLVPGLAKTITYYMNDKSISAGVLKLLRSFDSNKDNKVTAAELRGTIVAQALRPDVVLSGDPDKTPDSLSLSLGFTAVPCTILK